MLVASCWLTACGGDDGGHAEKRDRGNRDIVLGAERSSGSGREPESSQDRSPNQIAKPRPRPRVIPPRIEQWSIPFPDKRKLETAAYVQRHYGHRTAELSPRVVVEHYTVTPTAQAAYDIFARDEPDVELQELPGLCAHFLIDRDGTIYQLVSVRVICRHTVGLNDVAIGVEHVGSSDSDVFDNRRQLSASIRLTMWLRCRFGIPVTDVIGHAESLSSPYHHERVPALRHQTHEDFNVAAMDRYRAELSTRPC